MSIFFIMGVSGCGKSTVGSLLAEKLNLPFFDGDDYHPESNIRKMREGLPLDDDDRRDWLEALNSLATGNMDTGAVIVCSALKQSYRNILSRGLEKRINFIYLEGSFEQISERLVNRRGHFMPSELLQSQFDTLEVPTDALRVSIDSEPSRIVGEIIRRLP